MKLQSLEPTAIARRSISLYQEYVNEGISEGVAAAAAIGELSSEVDELEEHIEQEETGLPSWIGGSR